MSPYHLKGRPIDQTFLWLVFGIEISMAISAQMSRMKHLLLLCIYCIWIWSLNIEYPKDSWLRPQSTQGRFMGIGEVKWGNDHYSCPDNGDNGVTQNPMVHQHLPREASAITCISPNFCTNIITTKQLDLSRSTSHSNPGLYIHIQVVYPNKKSPFPRRKPQPSSVKDRLMSMAQELSRALLCRLEARGDGYETSPMVNTYIGYIYIYIYIHRVHIHRVHIYIYGTCMYIYIL